MRRLHQLMAYRLSWESARSGGNMIALGILGFAALEGCKIGDSGCVWRTGYPLLSAGLLDYFRSCSLKTFSSSQDRNKCMTPQSLIFEQLNLQITLGRSCIALAQKYKRYSIFRDLTRQAIYVPEKQTLQRTAIGSVSIHSSWRPSISWPTISKASSVRSRSRHRLR